MKRLAPLLFMVLLAPLLLAGIRLGNTATQLYTWDGCDGGMGQTVPEGSYALSITDSKVWMCVDDAGCAAPAGWPVTAGLVMTIDFSRPTVISCRSADMTGDIGLLKTP